MVKSQLAVTTSAIVFVFALAVNVHAGANKIAHSGDGACDPAWDPFLGEAPATGTVRAMTVFDAPGGGGGPALYAAGSLSFPGMPEMHFAKWDGV